MPPINANIAILKSVRTKIADVYHSEASDNIYDNGTLTELNDALLRIQNCIQALVNRDNE